MIKLLRIDKLVWIIVQIIYISAEAMYVLFASILIFLYNFNWRFNNLWVRMHSAENDWDNKYGGYSYIDRSIIDTFKRRYKDFF